MTNAGKLIAEMESEFNAKTNALIERHAEQIESLTAEKEVAGRKIEDLQRCVTDLRVQLEHYKKWWQEETASLAQAREDIAAIYDNLGIKGEDRCPDGLKGQHILNTNAIRLQREAREAAEQREKELLAALNRYGEHDEDCQVTEYDHSDCTCGFKDALAAASKEEKND